MNKPDKQLTQTIFFFLLINILVIYLAYLFYPIFVVLGNQTFSTLIALFISALTLSLVQMGAASALESLARQQKLKLKMSHWILIRLFANTAALWLIARLAGLFELSHDYYSASYCSKKKINLPCFVFSTRKKSPPVLLSLRFSFS